MNNDLVKAFKALANENRFELINILRDACCLYSGDEEENLPDQCLCVGDMVDRLNLTQATVSHHLKELENSGLLIRMKNGTRVFYMVNTDLLNKIKEYFSFAPCCENGEKKSTKTS